jgi:hypothetical protein
MRSEISPCDAVGVAIGVLVLLGVALTLPDFIKYLKLKAM